MDNPFSMLIAFFITGALVALVMLPVLLIFGAIAVGVLHSL